MEHSQTMLTRRGSKYGSDEYTTISSLGHKSLAADLTTKGDSW